MRARQYGEVTQAKSDTLNHLLKLNKRRPPNAFRRPLAPGELLPEPAHAACDTSDPSRSVIEYSHPRAPHAKCVLVQVCLTKLLWSKAVPTAPTWAMLQRSTTPPKENSKQQWGLLEAEQCEQRGATNAHQWPPRTQCNKKATARALDNALIDSRQTGRLQGLTDRQREVTLLCHLYSLSRRSPLPDSFRKHYKFNV
jgi:hypothetical protein